MPEDQHALKQWQQSLIDSGTVQAGEVDELTTHLVEQMQSLQSQGLTEEEAFIIATRRIGKPAELAEEFNKLNPLARWRSRLLWMVGGHLVIEVVGFFAIFLAIMPMLEVLAFVKTIIHWPYQWDGLAFLTLAALFFALVLAAITVLARAIANRGWFRPSMRLSTGAVFLLLSLCLGLLLLFHHGMIAAMTVGAGAADHALDSSRALDFMSALRLSQIVTAMMLLFLGITMVRRPRHLKAA